MIEKQNEEEAKVVISLDAHRNLLMANQYNEGVLTWARISGSDSLCHKFRGYALTEFAELVTLLQHELLPDSSVYRGRPARILDTVESRLRPLLNWLRFGQDFDVLAASFGTSRSHVHEIAYEVLGHCAPVLAKHYIVKLSHKQQAELGYLFSQFPQAAVIVDGTDHVISPHKKYKLDDQHDSDFYSYKLNHAAFRSISFHACNGLLMFSKTAPAVMGELTMVLSELETVCVSVYCVQLMFG